MDEAAEPLKHAGRKHCESVKTLRRLRLLPSDPPPDRPRTRGDCKDGPRPCPFVGCRHHLYLEVSHVGSVQYNFPGLEPEQLLESCALDVADRGEHSLSECGEMLNVSKQNIEQIEFKASRKLVEEIEQ